MIEVNERIRIPESELQESFTRASGPGGQNVNKVSSAVQLRFDAANSPSLPTAVKARLARLAGSRMSADGVLLIEARHHRSQERNRAEARQRLTTLLQRAAKAPKARKATKPSKAARRKRLEDKRRRAQLKRQRRPPRYDEGG